ncbi:MAG: murein hydrolase activator EnvC family protein [Ignavibacteriales bacterium]
MGEGVRQSYRNDSKRTSLRARAVALACCAALCLSLLAAVPVVTSNIARAGELEDRRQELDRVNQEIERYRQAITQKQGQEKSLLSELKRLETQLQAAQNDLAYLETRLQSTERAIAESEVTLKETEQALTKRTDLLQRRLTWLYKVGPMGYLEVILGSANIQDFLSRFEMVRAVINQDVSLAADLKEDKQDLEAQKAALEEKRSQLSSLKTQTALKREQVTSRTAERQQFLKQVTKEKSEYEKALDELEELSERLTQVIKDLQAKQSYKPGGPISMMWPARARISSPYGMRKHPITKTYRMHSGIDIAAARGTNILAAEAGIVLHAGLLGGYGKAIIIDHGNGVSTLYGHCDTLLVSVDQTVQKGFLIGKVGSTGLSTGPHLHFEVRVNGATKDPMAYLPK